MRLIIVVAALAAAVGCKKDQCTGSENQVTPSSASVTWTKCSDDKDRRVACEVAGQQWSCTCTLAGTAGKTFQLPFNGTVNNQMITGDVAKEHCGWSFAP